MRGARARLARAGELHRAREIGLAGVAAAITAAVHHATGVRVRELPVRIEHLLQSKVLEA